MIEQAFHFAVSDYHYAVKSAVIDDILWHWTQLHGKAGKRYWSEQALLNDGEYIIEEQVIPRKYIHQLLVEQTPNYITKEDIAQLLQAHLYCCVITEAEDHQLRKMNLSERMPDSFTDPTHTDYQNPWIRYKLAGINPLKGKISQGV